MENNPNITIKREPADVNIAARLPSLRSASPRSIHVKWSVASTRALIRLRGPYASEPAGQTDAAMWSDIAQRMRAESDDFAYEPEQLIDRWQALMRMYIVLLQDKIDLKTRTDHWEYFRDMDAHRDKLLPDVDFTSSPKRQKRHCATCGCDCEARNGGAEVASTDNGPPLRNSFEARIANTVPKYQFMRDFFVEYLQQIERMKRDDDQQHCEVQRLRKAKLDAMAKSDGAKLKMIRQMTDKVLEKMDY